MPIYAPYEPNAEFWRDRKVLVTGHTGFKGGWLALWLTALGARVSGLALPPVQSPSFFDSVGVEGICDHHLIDVRNFTDVSKTLHACEPEIVFHLAAQSLVRQSYREPVTTVATNVLGTAHVL